MFLLLCKTLTYSKLQHRSLIPFKYYLENNKITSINSDIKSLINLKVLTLSNNKIVNIPLEIKYLQALSELDLENNQLSSLPYEITKLPKLRRLYLAGNLFSEDEKEKINSWFKDSKCKIYWSEKF